MNFISLVYVIFLDFYNASFQIIKFLCKAAVYKTVTKQKMKTLGGPEFTDSLGRLFLDPEDRLEFASISRLFEPFEFLSIFSDILSDNLSDSSLSDCPRLLADTDVRLLPPLDF